MTVSVYSACFASLVCLIFYCVPAMLRLPLLCVSSFLYIFSLNTVAGIAVLGAAVFAWIIGLLTGNLLEMGKHEAGRIVTGLAIFASAASLLLLKYIPAAAERVFERDHFLADVMVPMGYSFFIFQVISYFADVYHGKTKPFRNIMRASLYLAWFPRFVCGPIERAEEFSRRMEEAVRVRLYDPKRWTRVIHYCVIGYFMKTVVADRLAIFADDIIDHYRQFSLPFLILGILFYTLQIYFDFAGYSCFALGVSLAFGIELTQNFLTPYFSANITEFWRRWHQSLSSWLRDYVYFPLGGNRHGTTRKIVYTLIVFLICGIWHGTGLNFIIWGLLHGLYSAADSFMKERGVNRIRTGIIGRILTFVSVAFAWLFFRASSTRTALGYLSSMVTGGLHLETFAEEAASLHLDLIEALVIIGTVLFVMLLEYPAYRRSISVPEMTSQMHELPRYSLIFVFLTSIFIFGIYGPEVDSTEMIYMQF